MSVRTFEGIVEKGQIKFKSQVNLPERTKVYVVVPDEEIEQTVYLHSPRLAHSEQGIDFKMEIVEASHDAKSNLMRLGHRKRGTTKSHETTRNKTHE